MQTPPPLRPFQESALSVLDAPQKLHVVVVAPTGSGKSRIFEDALATGSFRRGLLISPLVALHRQHAARLEQRGLSVRIGVERPTAPILGPQSRSRTRSRSDRRQVWILSPESLEHDQVRSTLSEYAPDLLVVDECHCVWDWGSSFRPSFARIPELAGLPEIKKSLWLTATLPVEARRALQQRLGEYGTVVEQGSFALPDRLKIDVRRIALEDRASVLLEELRQGREATIVFSVTRQGTERLRRLCAEMRLEAVPYHAGLSREERLNIERGISEGRIRLVIATSAFGMGMDFPTLRRAVLWQAPLSLLDLAQAVGRVARGDSGGSALCLWHPDDFRLVQWSVGGQARRARQMLEVHRYLDGSGCHRERLERAFLPAAASNGGRTCIELGSQLTPCSRCLGRSRIIGMTH